jgi:hypothetical protein
MHFIDYITEGKVKDKINKSLDVIMKHPAFNDLKKKITESYGLDLIREEDPAKAAHTLRAETFAFILGRAVNNSL